VCDQRDRRLWPPHCSWRCVLSKAGPYRRRSAQANRGIERPGSSPQSAGRARIRVASELFPNKPQVAVFDTAFHQTLPRMHFTTRFRRSFTLSIMSAVMGFTEQAFNTLPVSWPGGFVGRLKNSKLSLPISETVAARPLSNKGRASTRRWA